MILESKMNYLTLEELELIDPNPYKVIVNKVLNEAITRTKNIEPILNRFARELANQETAETLPKLRGLSFDSTRKIWRAERHIKKKRIHIITSWDRDVVVNKLIDFCKENNLRY